MEETHSSYGLYGVLHVLFVSVLIIEPAGYRAMHMLHQFILIMLHYSD